MNKKNQIEHLLKEMTIDEKIGQLFQAPYYSDVITGPAYDSSETVSRIKQGLVGSILSVHDEKTLFALQKTAVEESRLGIPLLFAFDIIHGYKTSFPINLALSNTWDPQLVEAVAKAVAYETAHRGLHLTFSPMLDIVKDPRWGRVMESNGEDPYLSSVLAKAYVDGYQQDNLSGENTVAACAKHFIGYGLSEAGREYNSVDLSKRVLFNKYLPPFASAIKAGVSMVMTSFNTVFDRPMTGNKYLLRDVLRNQLNFDGVVISDYTSTEELINHKVAEDLKDVAYQCLDAGLEMEMVSESYIRHLSTLVNEEKIDISIIDDAVKHILGLKYDLGLFDNPYKYFYEDSDKYLYKDEAVSLSKEAAEKSMVLLKNDHILPINNNQSIVLCGPFVNSSDIIGEWRGLAENKDVITIETAFKNDRTINSIASDDEEDIKSADVIIMALGENGYEAGEGNSKVNIHLEQTQKEYFDKIYQLNENIVLVVFAGRPLIMTYYHNHAKAILYAFQPGMQGGPAIKRLLMGEKSPSGKLTMTFPYHEGQVPVYYNHLPTGRPINPNNPDYRYNTRYRDCQNEPLYPFGFGLSYGKFVYSNLKTSTHILEKYDKLLIQLDVNNESDNHVDEIIQCYIEACTFSVSRPVNELKAFKKVSFKPHETKKVEFELTMDDFRSYNIDMDWTAESRSYKVKVGSSSQHLLERTIKINDF